jgi:hypothetical protein
MFRKMFTTAAPIFALAAVSSITSFSKDARADQRDFQLFNELPWVIDELYVSPNDRASWGHDILGQDVLNPRESVTIHFNHEYKGECIFDIKVVRVGDHSSFEVQDVNLCQVSKFAFYHPPGSKVVKWAAR